MVGVLSELLRSASTAGNAILSHVVYMHAAQAGGSCIVFQVYTAKHIAQSHAYVHVHALVQPQKELWGCICSPG